MFFLAFALYKADYLIIPKIISYNHLLLSFLLLFFSFILFCFTWLKSLKQNQFLLITKRDSVISNGLSVFAKYIPGKVMIIFGRALYIHKKYDTPLKAISMISFSNQLLSILVGLAIGFIILFKINVSFKLIIVSALLIIMFIIILYSKYIRKTFNNLLRKLINKNINYPILSLKDSLDLFPIFIFHRVIESTAFYLLVLSLLDYHVSFIVGFSFALSSTLAILALIAPGGLGVREGLLVICLLAFGIEKQDAITISVASRLWFLIGEVFIFILALFLNIRDKNNLLENKKGFLSTKQ